MVGPSDTLESPWLPLAICPCKQAQISLTDLPPRKEEEVDSVTLHNQVIKSLGHLVIKSSCDQIIWSSGDQVNWWSGYVVTRSSGDQVIW
jgi:hypothetical protein